MGGGGDTKNVAISYPGLIAIPPGWTGIILVHLSLQNMVQYSHKETIAGIIHHITSALYTSAEIHLALMEKTGLTFSHSEEQKLH